MDRCFYEERSPEQEYHDLVFFGVHKPWLTDSADRPYFIHIDGFVREDRVVSFFYGHPRSRTEIEYEPSHMYVRQAYIDGRLDAQFVSHAQHYRRYSYPKVDYEMDGFSGGAVFSLIGSLEAGLRVELDGIIVRGGGGYLYAVDADYLQRALDSFSERPLAG